MHLINHKPASQPAGCNYLFSMRCIRIKMVFQLTTPPNHTHYLRKFVKKKLPFSLTSSGIVSVYLLTPNSLSQVMNSVCLSVNP